MSRHPVTPMDEADLRLHLARQGLKPMAAMHHPDYDLDDAAQDVRLDALLAGHPRAVLFDAGQESHLRHIGRMLWRRALAQPRLAADDAGYVDAVVDDLCSALQAGRSVLAYTTPMAVPACPAAGALKTKERASRRHRAVRCAAKPLPSYLDKPKR